MVETETGWTKEFPKVEGDYFCRLNEHDLCPVSFRLENGKIYEYGCGGNLYSQYVAKWDDYEYLGPFTASDAEQLSELRKALLGVRNGMGCWCRTPFVNASEDRPHETRCLAVFAVLNPKHPEKETQGK